jgi:hypothetical protein
MARLGHSTAKASMAYQAAVDERQAAIAEAMSALASKQKLNGQCGESGQSSAYRLRR